MSETEALEKHETDLEAGEDDWLYCAACGYDVTRLRFAAHRRGDHLHTVFNPSGRLFAVRCFARADGAEARGSSTGDFTWFPGYDWRLAFCRRCSAHLGWRYDGPDGFYGLIKQALTRVRK